MTPKVYLDTNVFIAAFEATGTPANDAWQILRSAESGRIEGVTSELTLAEVLSKPPENAHELIATYQLVVSNRLGLSVPSVTRAVLIAAARIRVESPSIKLPDAIHLATALDSACTHVISADRRLPKTFACKLVPFGPNSLDAIGSDL